MQTVTDDSNCMKNESYNNTEWYGEEGANLSNFRKMVLTKYSKAKYIFLKTHI